MNYKSTRNNDVTVSASVAISRGISEDGGLFVPETMPWLSYTDLQILTDSDYVARANDILSRFLGDFTPGEVLDCVSRAYTREKFETESIAPLYELNPGVYLLELWHGPTCAFKDMALQLLPHLLSVSTKKANPGKTVVILVATSGDTGKAALEGFRDVPGTRILVFYPEQGVSPMQKMQMLTQEGENVFVSAIHGNFDDAQAGVKAVFTDAAVKEKLAAHNMVFSSANSINWGRLVPQIVYYVSSYCDLIKNNRISAGEHINIVVPTGNFGNILAAYYAKKMGIPINKLICASNANNVLTEFLQTGIYDRNRPFYTTISPSMDILISSNLERLLYDLSACDDGRVRDYMDSLSKTGRYEVDDSIKKSIAEHFWAGYCDDAGTRATIKDVYERNACVSDPHTAVALNVYQQYREKSGDETKTIIASTASPYKFAGDVVNAIRGEQTTQTDQRVLVEELSKLMLSKPPKQIAALFQKPVRFQGVCDAEAMQDTIFAALDLA
ncbi:MAG: threonine synthase [Ethanoligenens sp.]|uniref:threonine synthase n=1 Tax=Ethanoligenens sp. TaxID=2099655 RepID=UPI0039EC2D30